jgi:outer membrane protein insertion porin family
MRLFFRLFGICLLLVCAPVVWSQTTGLKIDRVDIKYVGPASVSEQFIRSNIRLKAGYSFQANATESDIRDLYATGQFYNIRVGLNQASDGGVIVTYIVQVRPRLTEIKIEGNKKLSTSKIRKKITVKVGQPLDEQKLFTDCQEIQKLYEKYGYAGTKVKYVVDVDENAGRGTATFQITEAPKVKIVRIEFLGAAAFSQRELRKQLKTKERWMFSWLTGSDVFKQDQFEDDQDALTQFYRNHGYLDFQIKDVRLLHPTPNTMDIQFFVFEGRQYKVGSIKFSGNKIFNDEQIHQGLQAVHAFERARGKLGPHGLTMDVGDTFTPDGLDKDLEAIEDFYGGKGYINVKRGPTLRAVQIPNVDTGTMDLEFQIDEGQKYYVERINIKGNIKTKDKVIRREMAIAPGEVFDMVRVKISKERLEGLQYFSKVDMEPEPTDPPIAGRQNLDVNVEEQNTGKITLGAGFSSVDSLVGFASIEQDNFDLFHPPTFTGGGQRARLFVQLGTQRQDYELLFSEPWFMNRKLRLTVTLYRHQWDFESPNNIYNETRTGASVSLTRALWSDFLIGSVGYSIEDVGINLNGGWHGWETVPGIISPIIPPPTIQIPPNVPSAILEQTGDHLFQHFTATLAYDTRNSTQLPNGGQRTEFDPEFVTGDSTYYKLELKSAWYFRGLFKSHVIELTGRTGVADGFGSDVVPFYDAYYLGGLYSLRGFKYRNIAPRDPTYGSNPLTDNPLMPNEPIGGDSFWFGSVDYYIPIIEQEGGVGLRLDFFYDAGSVSGSPYSASGPFDDDAGIGLLLNIPHLGPLQLYYGVPITHDQYNSGSGQFQFGFGYAREF